MKKIFIILIVVIAIYGIWSSVTSDQIDAKWSLDDTELIIAVNGIEKRTDISAYVDRKVVRDLGYLPPDKQLLAFDDVWSLGSTCRVSATRIVDTRTQGKDVIIDAPKDKTDHGIRDLTTFDIVYEMTFVKKWISNNTLEFERAFMGCESQKDLISRETWQYSIETEEYNEVN